jgi:hypothetical protein
MFCQWEILRKLCKCPWRPNTVFVDLSPHELCSDWEFCFPIGFIWVGSCAPEDGNIHLSKRYVLFGLLTDRLSTSTKQSYNAATLWIPFSLRIHLLLRTSTWSQVCCGKEGNGFGESFFLSSTKDRWPLVRNVFQPSHNFACSLTFHGITLCVITDEYTAQEPWMIRNGRIILGGKLERCYLLTACWWDIN